MRRHLLIAAIVLLALGLASALAQASNEQRFIIIVGDSCAYEVASRIPEVKPELKNKITIISFNDIYINIKDNDIIVILTTRGTSSFALRNIMSFVSNIDNNLIITSNINITYNNIISVISEDAVWRACHGDQEALLDVASHFRTVPPPDTHAETEGNPLLFGAILLGIVGALMISNELKESRFARRASEAILLPILRYGVRCEDALNHNLRISINEIVENEGAASFRDVMRRLGVARGIMEWHIFVLTRCGFIRQIRFGRRRVLVPEYPRCKTLQALEKIDPRRTGCIVGLLEQGLSPEQVIGVAAERCRVTGDVDAIVRVIYLSWKDCSERGLGATNEQ